PSEVGNQGSYSACVAVAQEEDGADGLQSRVGNPAGDRCPSPPELSAAVGCDQRAEAPVGQKIDEGHGGVRFRCPRLQLVRSCLQRIAVGGKGAALGTLLSSRPLLEEDFGGLNCGIG